MAFYDLVYVSVARQSFSDDDLKALLKQSREKNERLNVTGMLLYRDGFFIQVLEGEKNTIDALYDEISKDSRHETLMIYKKPVEERIFPSWTMGFNKIDDQKLETLDGYTNFLTCSKPDFFKNVPSRAEELLNLFKHDIFF